MKFLHILLLSSIWPAISSAISPSTSEIEPLKSSSTTNKDITKEERKFLNEHFKNRKSENVSPIYQLKLGASMGTYSFYMKGSDQLGMGDITVSGSTTILSASAYTKLNNFTYSLGFNQTRIAIDKNLYIGDLPNVNLNNYYSNVNYRTYATDLTLEIGMMEVPGGYINQDYQIEITKTPLPYVKAKISEEILKGFKVGANVGYMVGNTTSKMAVTNGYMYGLSSEVDIYKKPESTVIIKGFYELKRTIVNEPYSKDSITETVLGLSFGF